MFIFALVILFINNIFFYCRFVILRKTDDYDVTFKSAKENAVNLLPGIMALEKVCESKIPVSEESLLRKESDLEYCQSVSNTDVSTKDSSNMKIARPRSSTSNASDSYNQSPSLPGPSSENNFIEKFKPINLGKVPSEFSKLLKSNNNHTNRVFLPQTIDRPKRSGVVRAVAKKPYSVPASNLSRNLQAAKPAYVTQGQSEHTKSLNAYSSQALLGGYCSSCALLNRQNGSGSLLNRECNRQNGSGSLLNRECYSNIAESSDMKIARPRSSTNDTSDSYKQSVASDVNVGSNLEKSCINTSTNTSVVTGRLSQDLPNSSDPNSNYSYSLQTCGHLMCSVCLKASKTVDSLQNSGVVCSSCNTFVLNKHVSRYYSNVKQS